MVPPDVPSDLFHLQYSDQPRSYIMKAKTAISLHRFALPRAFVLRRKGYEWNWVGEMKGGAVVVSQEREVISRASAALNKDSGPRPR